MSNNSDMRKICGNCMCLTLFNNQVIGRCRRYNTIVQLETVCLDRKDWKCKCLIKKEDCSHKMKYLRERGED